MDRQGKFEIEQAFIAYGYDTYQAGVATEPGEDNVPFVEIYYDETRPSDVLNALAKAGLARDPSKIEGPMLNPISFTVKETQTGADICGLILLEDANASSINNESESIQSS
jgi:hypothetical protein